MQENIIYVLYSFSLILFCKVKLSSAICSISLLLLNRAIGLMSTVFANGPEDLGSIPGQVIPKIPKMVLDAALLNTQHCKDQG